MHLTRFIHQKSYEHIAHKVRRHLITMVPTLIGSFFLLLLPMGVYWLTQSVFPTLLESTIAFPLLVLLGSIYYLSVALFFYTYFVTFYLDLLIVTNDRLLHIQQHGLFARTISEVDLYHIQDLTSEVKGFFASTFNYGSLSIQTAGAVEKFHIRDIPNPDGLRQTIAELAEEDRKYHSVK
ncbi:MAG TPA: PH domain-containing protein [Patescibacteria group bacterium]|nr:PH domain-containing protein [Patescibacteria group bacterium]